MERVTNNKIKNIRDSIHRLSGRKIGATVAKELLVLAGGDEELVVYASTHSDGLDQCKALIIDERIRSIEEYLGFEILLNH